MELRNFGKRSGYMVAPVSIGAMRFPPDALDAVGLVRHAIDSGMRYIDTSRGYGESEYVLSRALRDGYRERVVLSTKCSPWIKKVTDADDGSADSVRRRIDESLLRLGVDYLDFYQVWNVNDPDAWELATRRGGMVDGIKRAVDEGLVRHIGFTTHEKPEALLRYLDEAEWCEILLVSYNLLKRDYEPVLEKAKDLGIGTIVMNPVGGGRFAEDSPVLMRLAEEVGAVSVADLAVRYVLSNPNVDTILCGMSKASDVDATIASARRTVFDHAARERVNDFFDRLSRESVSFCTNCGYCQPCPAGIKIPSVMSSIYEGRFLGFAEGARKTFRRATAEVKVDACTRCGSCEKKCTQGLEIIRELQYAASEYGQA